ncbi:MAG: flavodoxin [Chloroflexi bacterium]|nr:flavodoxin [Chloroflexota bacterium]
MSVLVAYATRAGSTEEVAREVAAVLEEQGHTVAVQAAKDVKSLDGVEGVLLGAPIYISKWHKDAHKFLQRFEETLTRLPLYIFALGPLEDNPEHMQDAINQLDAELRPYTWLQPDEVTMFVGKFDPADLTFPFSLINALPASPMKEMLASDNRDWNAIRGWAAGLFT